MAACRLYLISPEVFELKTFSHTLSKVLTAGDISYVQLRMKNAEDNVICRATRELHPICRDHGVPLLLNDRPDLIEKTGADGVHIGQEDASIKSARKFIGPGSVLGVTCHDSLALAEIAANAGADYVAFGSFYTTATKVPKTFPPPELLTLWKSQSNLPSVAIGGINPSNCAPLVTAGANHVAAISSVWNNPSGPAEAVRAFQRSIDIALQTHVNK